MNFNTVFSVALDNAEFRNPRTAYIESGSFCGFPRTGSSVESVEVFPHECGPKGVAALFERVYTERLVYKAIAERDPNCPNLFDALKKNDQICSGITAAFGHVYQRLDANEDLLTALKSLPTLAGQP